MRTIQTQAQTSEVDYHVLLPNNPFVPPKGDVCFINKLPPELLSHIFVVSATYCSSEEEADLEDYMEGYCYRQLQNANAKDTHEHNVGMIEELKDYETGDQKADEGNSESSDEPLGPGLGADISHVCRHWRNIALSTPSLWTDLIVGVNARPPYHRVSTQLERTISLPIDIFVDSDPYDDTESNTTNRKPPSEADLRFLCSLLTPHIHRWRVVQIATPDYRLMHVFLSAVSHPSISSAPQLTQLFLSYYGNAKEFDDFRYQSMSKHVIPFGGSAPCLTRVVLRGVHVDWSQPWIASAPKLRYLELADHIEDVRPSWAQFTSILRGASSLKRFTLRQSGPSGDPPEWFIEPTLGGPGELNAPVQLPKVTSFLLSFVPQAHAIGLFHKLYFPALETLVLELVNADYTEFVDELTRPATSLSVGHQPPSLLSNLKVLKLAGLWCHNVCVEKIYGELQNLTSLSLSLSYIPRLFLGILSMACTLPGHGNIWLPRLSILCVSETSGNALREVVNARRDMGVPLDSLYVEESGDLGVDDVQWLRENLNMFDFLEESDVGTINLGEEGDDE